MIRILILIFTISLIQTISSLHAEDMTLEVIPLQHRMSDDVVDVLRPLIAPGGTVTGMNNQLVIKTTPANLAEIKEVLQSLDRTPRKLLITVKQDTSGIVRGNKQSLNGSYTSGDVNIKNENHGGDRGGLVISAEDEDGNNIRYRTVQTSKDFDDSNSFRVQAVEGYPAFIHTGQIIPVSNHIAYVRPDGVTITRYTEYQDATSGFYVMPRLNGDQVTLLVAPRLTRMQPGSKPVFDTQTVETTANGNLGEWMRIGGIDQSFTRDSNHNLSSSSTSGQQSNTILIRVDEIK